MNGLPGLSLAIADALQGGDLDAVERLVAARGRLLDALVADASAATIDPATARLIADADGRSRAALTDAMATTRRELGELAAGAHAMRGYLAEAPTAPGYVDSRD